MFHGTFFTFQFVNTLLIFSSLIYAMLIHQQEKREGEYWPTILQYIQYSYLKINLTTVYMAMFRNAEFHQVLR